MPFFRKSSQSSTSSSASLARGENIPVDYDNSYARRQQKYAGEPQDMGAPAFTRTGSFYSTASEHPQYDYLKASDVRRQVREAPSGLRKDGGFPKYYGNQPPIDLRAEPPLREYPIMPSSRNGYESAPRNYEHGRAKGPVRAFYNENDRMTFDVGYHDTSRPPTAPRDGRKFPSTPYTLGTYTPGPDYVDTATYKSRR